jgi:hypothetical protein
MTVYAYPGARVIPLIAAAFLISLAVAGRHRLRGNAHGILTMGLGAALVIAPMLPWILSHPDTFNERFNQVGIFPSGWLAREVAARDVSAWQVLAEQAAAALLSFNFIPVGWFYQAAVPMLGPLTGVLFALGLAYSLMRWRDPRFLLLNLWFAIPLITGQVLMITPGGSGYRTLSLLPAVCIMAGVALIRLADAIFGRVNGGRRWAIAAVVAALAFEGLWNVNYYFKAWAPGHAYSDPMSRTASLLAEYVRDLEPDRRTFVLGTERFRASGWAVMDYLAAGRRFSDIISLDVARSQMEIGGKYAFVLLPESSRELLALEQLYPAASKVEHRLGGVVYFVSYEFTGPTGFPER